MTSELRVDNLKGSTTGGSINVLGEGTSATTNMQQGLCKAWVHVHDNASIDDSFNISAIEDTGTGNIKTTYTNNMANDDYAGSGLARLNSSGGDAFMRFSSSITTSQTIYICANESGTDIDGETQTMLTHGDLA
mgnify:CR=1 FL=1